ncbi:MAG: ABC transporter permease [Planctomycetes bacterium]|nr:ABC transporter permease [Planctomycetota bacterium]MBL7009493.1 ABC transporter permease [Planctomycetota bacterium]
MKYAFLIALREYAENAKTKGFWIGILLFPVLIMIGISLPRFLEEHATPTRFFMVVDQSGEASEIIREATDRHQERRIYDACIAYSAKHPSQKVKDLAKAASEAAKEGAADDLVGKLPGDMAELQDRMEAWKEEGFQAFRQVGGHEAFLAIAEGQGFLAEDRPPFELPNRKFVQLDPAGQLDVGAPGEELSAEIKRRMLVDDGGFEFEGKPQELFAAVLIPADIFAGPSGQKVEFWTKNLADDDLRSLVGRALNSELRERGFAAAGVDPAEILRIQSLEVDLKAKDPNKKAGEEEADTGDFVRQWAPAGFVYLLWIALMSVVTMLLNNTVEEKSNRIVEVLLSSVTPGELMTGKLFGIAAVGLTMLLAWLVALVGILTWRAGPEAEVANLLLEVIKDSGLIVPFLGYFVAAYLLYAGIFLAIGSVCNTVKEAQNFMSPVMIVMIVPLLTMMFIPKDPNGTLATVLSWVPLYTPFIMMNRWGSADLPMFDLIGTSIVLAVSVVIMIWLTGKIFRTAILRTGQPPKLLEMLRWVKSKD